MHRWMYVKNEKDVNAVFLELQAIVDKYKIKPSILAKAVREEWEKLVDEKVVNTSGPTGRDYVARYKKGMKVMAVGDRVVARLTGFEANRVERGWAPPSSTEMIDGLGEYDGRMHDMRPFMLNGSRFKFIKMDVPKPSAEIIADVRQNLVYSLMKENATKSEERSARIRAGIHTKRFAEGHDGKPGLLGLKTGEALNKEFTEMLSKEKRKHAFPIYHHIVRTKTMDGKRKWIFSTFRTISDSDNQMRRRLWFSRGTKPVKLMEKLPNVLKKLIMSGGLS